MMLRSPNGAARLTVNQIASPTLGPPAKGSVLVVRTSMVIKASVSTTDSTHVSHPVLVLDRTLMVRSSTTRYSKIRCGSPPPKEQPTADEAAATKTAAVAAVRRRCIG